MAGMIFRAMGKSHSRGMTRSERTVNCVPRRLASQLIASFFLPSIPSGCPGAVRLLGFFFHTWPAFQRSMLVSVVAAENLASARCLLTRDSTESFHDHPGSLFSEASIPGTPASAPLRLGKKSLPCTNSRGGRYCAEATAWWENRLLFNSDLRSRI